jgi:putrescine:ornithine antiporter
MLYSTYALYASGTDAVMGGMLVAAVTYIIWGFISYRFVEKRSSPRTGVLEPAVQPPARV